MPTPQVLITFYSRRGETERLATAAAVGAVEGRSSIRLRRVPDADPQSTAEEPPELREHLDRMRREYVAPKDADVLWADALIFGAPADFTEGSAEWRRYLDLLAALESQGRLRNKVAAVVGSEPGRTALSRAMAGLALVVVPSESIAASSAPSDRIAAATRTGRRVADAVRELKERGA